MEQWLQQKISDKRHNVCVINLKCVTYEAVREGNNKRNFFIHVVLHIGIEEEASEVLHLEHSFIWC